MKPKYIIKDLETNKYYHSKYWSCQKRYKRQFYDFYPTVYKTKEQALKEIEFILNETDLAKSLVIVEVYAKDSEC